MNNAARIMVVDDDPDITDQLSLLLTAEGYEVAVANGQEEGELALLTSQPDLAIVDLMMEERDSGLVLCHRIKRIYPGTPVILLTSVNSTTALSFAVTSAEQQTWVKADRLLDKPIRAEQIRQEVRKLLVRTGKVTATAGGGERP